MKFYSILSLICLLAPVAANAQAIATKEDQIASAVLAAPEERRAEATVLGYDAEGKLVTLRKGTNDLICLADNPKDNKFSVACYHKDLEPYMARGRELEAQGIHGNARNANYRWKEVKEGTLAMPKEPRMLYVLSGKGYDAASGKVIDSSMRWVLYWPFATAETTGLSTKSNKIGEPWLMDAGTPGAHVMINPPVNPAGK
ncbi:MAG: hypothetical protein J2P31_11175 [Blastocatellia bacterium]|nr:hypothetical protein [Blastocatellia bacterium]